MKGLISKSDVVRACLQGVINAQNEYYAMSGSWLGWAPEYFITSNIAQSLHKTPGSKFVTIENGAYDALTDAGAVGQGVLHSDIRSNGRFDLLLWWAKGSPRAIIEVKNRVINKAQYEADLRRITAVLSRKKLQTTMKFGLLVFYTACEQSRTKTAYEILNQRANHIESNAKSIVGNQFKVEFEKSEIIEDDIYAWFAGCIAVSHV